MAQKALYDLTLKISANSAELSKGIKEANQKLDGFERNVGNQLKKVQGAFLTAAGVIASLKGVLETVKAGFNATGEGADFLEKKTVALKTGFQQLAKSIVDADFANLLQNFKAAAKAGEEYSMTLDEVNTRISDLSVLQATLSSRVATLRVKQQEGTITKAEVIELEKTTKQLLDIEKDIYDEAIQAQLKFIANKNKLDESLLSSVSKGIAERAKMSREELAQLNSVTEEYDKFYDEMIKRHTEVTYARPSGDSMPVSIKTVNYKAVNEEMEKYIANLTDVQKAQLTENKLSNVEEWNKLIEFLVKRNNLEGEYANLLRRIVTAGNQVKEASPQITRVEGITPISTSGIAIPSVAPSIDTTKLVMPAETFKKSWIDALTEVNNNLLSLGDTFRGLANIIESASADGEISFAESMSIIQEAAMSTVSILGALAAAQVISAEASKGLIGIVTAIGALAMLAELWSSFVTPDKYASGTSYAAGGWSLVGENGPELVNMPKGSQVLSNLQTRNMLAGKVVFEIGNGVIRGALQQNARLNKSYA